MEGVVVTMLADVPVESKYSWGFGHTYINHVKPNKQTIIFLPIYATISNYILSQCQMPLECAVILNVMSLNESTSLINTYTYH